RRRRHPGRTPAYLQVGAMRYLANFSASSRSHDDACDVKPEVASREDLTKRARHQFIKHPTTSLTQLVEAKMGK
ncbi:MAG TPA: hypothetical protein VFP68_16740, partial [Burkholderiaceae bacterium]|nr:hypothetical protein [Burkholderiaceae bacterium]